jgi:nucleoside-diphosphate-sugar epimerase
MKTLVTGGTGFVGSHLVETLRREGHEVTALVRSPHKATRFPALGVRSVAGDLHHRAALEEAAAGREVVYHVAGLVAARNEAEFLRANRDGTRNVVEAASRQGRPRFILVSSLAAGGPSEPGRPRSLDEPPRPVTAYGRSKLAAEEAVRQGPLPWTIVRPPTVYGPRDTALLTAFKLAQRGIGPVFGGGQQELSAVFGADLAEALVAAAASDSTVSRIYCPCHPERLSSREMVEALARAVGRGVRMISLPASVARLLLTLIGGAARLVGRATLLNRDKADEFLAPAWTGDPAPLTRDTGWRAAHDLASGLAETVAWYRQEGWL